MKIKTATALTLIIDNQVRLLPSITASEELLKNTALLLQGLKLLEVPLIITQQYTKGLGMSDASIYLHAQTTEYLEKRTFSCWGDAAIRQKIMDSGRRQIILCGIEAHICVLQTALDLVRAGYEVILVEDCVSSRQLSDKETALKRMIQEGVAVTSYESLLFELMETSLHPRFKEISKLIK
ncbi:MAG: isochorismatase family protein [Clostridiales bacterium]|nr:isochorismatase family protein [Clostridiales bacterium]